MTPWVIVATIVAGGIGAGIRYVVDALVTRGRSGGFPWGIFVVNVTGSLLLGFTTAFWAQTALVTVLGLGLLGGYTTFSTVSVETGLLAERGQWRRATLNAVGTLLACIPAAALGLLMGDLLHG